MMSVFKTVKSKLEEEEKKLKKEFFNKYGSAKEMIEAQGARVVSSDQNLLLEVSKMVEDKDLTKVG